MLNNNKVLSLSLALIAMSASTTGAWASTAPAFTVEGALNLPQGYSGQTSWMTIPGTKTMELAVNVETPAPSANNQTGIGVWGTLGAYPGQENFAPGVLSFAVTSADSTMSSFPIQGTVWIFNSANQPTAVATIPTKLKKPASGEYKEAVSIDLSTLLPANISLQKVLVTFGANAPSPGGYLHFNLSKFDYAGKKAAINTTIIGQ